MRIEVDLEDRTPPYQQIRAGVFAAVATGELAPGDRLPTVRQLAQDLGLAVNTVQRAYAELESDGVVRSEGRRGTRVAQPAGATRSAGLGRAARSFVREALGDGARPDEVLRAVAQALATRTS